MSPKQGTDGVQDPRKRWVSDPAVAANLLEAQARPGLGAGTTHGRIQKYSRRREERWSAWRDQPGRSCGTSKGTQVGRITALRSFGLPVLHTIQNSCGAEMKSTGGEVEQSSTRESTG